MADRISATSHELLLEQAGFLRQLARDLVGNAQDADDAVQDVWVAALERPPQHEQNLRGWLGAVLRNLASKRARGEVRRSQREREAARPERVRETSASLESETLLRSVTEAVLALEEPYRSTVLQRYFEGLSPSEIARRQSLPVATVKSRLQRALTQLRTRLERSTHLDGGALRSMLIAIAWPGPALPWWAAGTHVTAFGKTVLFMNSKAKIAIAGAALLAGFLVCQRIASAPENKIDSRPSAASLPPVLEDPAADRSRLVATSADSAESRARVQVGTPPDASASSAQSIVDTLLYGSLLDPEGRPLRGLVSAGVSLADSSGRLRFSDAQSDGTYAFHGLPCGTYWATVDGDGFRTSEQRIELRPEQLHLRQDFKLQRAPVLRVRVTTPEGENFADAFKRAKAKEQRWENLGFPVPVATKDAPGKWFAEMGGQIHGTFGVGQYWDFGPKVKTLPKGCMGVLILDHELPVYVSLLARQRVLQTKQVQPGEEEVAFVLSLEDFVASAATISMQVVDAGTLAPIRGARVELEDGSPKSGGARTDANGNVVIKDHDPGEFQLRVSAQDHEDYARVLLADSGTTTDLGQIALGEGIRFEARVLDARGAPCGELFKLGVLDPSTHALTMSKRSFAQERDPSSGVTTPRERTYSSNADGVLEIRNLGRRVYVIRADDGPRVTDGDHTGARWASGNIIVDLRSGTAPANLEIRLQPASWLVLSVKDGKAGGLRFRVVDEAGLERVADRFQRASPRSFPLPQGSYRVQWLDELGQPLSEQPILLGAGSATVELAR